jgi:hypothetical protein
MNRFAIAAAVLCIVGCGGGGGSSSFTIRGQSFSAVETISAVQTTSSSSVGVVIFSGRSGICALAASNTNPKNTKGLLIVVSNNGTALVAGAYTVTASFSAGKIALVQFVSYDNTCGDITAQEANGVSGTVTLTSVSGNALAGSYDITFDSTDHITGSFTGTGCVIPSSTGTASCG